MGNIMVYLPEEIMVRLYKEGTEDRPPARIARDIIEEHYKRKKVKR